ncbi:hypothetical protein IFO70_32390 [Phormidium tenue FACHB-886]|nr:hypothetical protein [Phormidium tenue FACHB-886]
MGCQYANLTLYGVNQDTLVRYLSDIGLDSYVSPTQNQFTVMYDSSFEIVPGSPESNSELVQLNYKASQMLEYTTQPHLKAMAELYRLAVAQSQPIVAKLKALDMYSGAIQKRYGGTTEGVLVCWASHLSKKFCCPAFAVYLRDDFQLWYHLSSNGVMVDEYATYATDDWQPGQGIQSELGDKIKGGNARELCNIFGKEAKVNEVEIILRKPHDSNSQHGFGSELNYGDLLSLSSFPNETLRHQSLALALGLPVFWVLYMSYSAISQGEAEDYFDDYISHDSSIQYSIAMLKQAQPN